MISTAQAAATGYTGVFRGRPDQVSRARHAIARHLAGHPAAADAALINRELAANAVLHSRSAGQFFTVRAKLSEASLRLEVEDLGGPWNPGPGDKLPAQARIIAELGISEATARRACRELARLGLIRLVPGHGYYPGTRP